MTTTLFNFGVDKPIEKEKDYLQMTTLEKMEKHNKSLEKVEVVVQTIIENPITDEQINSLKSSIIKELYLWDMRCWDKYKDKEEILKWLDNGCSPNNCGHTEYCINRLLKNGISKEEIISLMMKNDNIQYKNRLVKCFDNAELCPKFMASKNFSECNCNECEKTQMRLNE